MKNVTDLLTVYQNAKCVVTRRLHCALPCLAMGVPVLTLNNEKAGADIRFEPYYDWLHNCSREEYISGEYDYDITDPPANPEKHLECRERLIKTVTDFAEKYKDVHGTAEELAKTAYTQEQLINWRHDTMKDCMNRWLYVTRGHIHTIAKLEKRSAKLDEEKKKSAELNKKLAAEKKLTEEQSRRIVELESKLAAAESGLAESDRQNKRMKKIISCRCVRYSVAARNAFVKKNKKIKIDDI